MVELFLGYLGRGEAEVLTLSKEKKADLILIDEKKARRVLDVWQSEEVFWRNNTPREKSHQSSYLFTNGRLHLFSPKLFPVDKFRKMIDNMVIFSKSMNGTKRSG